MKLNIKLEVLDRYKIIILSILIILINVFFNFPYFSNLKEINSRLSQEAINLETAYNQRHSHQRALNRYQEISKEIPSYEELFIIQGNELELIQNLEKLAEQNDLKQEIALSQTIQDKNLKIYQLGLRLSISGNYFDIINYLNDIKEFGYKLTISMLDLQNAENNLGLTLLASTYWLYD